VLVNHVRETDIVSLYAWNPGCGWKGVNLLESGLEPGAAALIGLAPGEYNVLAFDGLGNSYGLRDTVSAGALDTLALDLQHIMYHRPNFDLGGYLVVLSNGLRGLALESIDITSAGSGESLGIGQVRIFPGWIAYLWLERGTYSVTATDQAGRVFTADSLTVPGVDTLRVTEEMLAEAREPLGMVGRGSCVLLIENNLAGYRIVRLEILPGSGDAGIRMEDLSLEPGDGIVAALDPGGYRVTATDDSGAGYSALVQLDDGGAVRLFLCSDYLEFDFGFPDRGVTRP
jgi:hypothetical protein